MTPSLTLHSKNLPTTKNAKATKNPKQDSLSGRDLQFVGTRFDETPGGGLATLTTPQTISLPFAGRLWARVSDGSNWSEWVYADFRSA